MDHPKKDPRLAWEHWAEKYTDVFESVHRSRDPKELEKMANYVMNHLRVQEGDAVLDAGCGSGVLSAAVRETGRARVWGMDFSLHHLLIMKKRYPSIPPVEGDVAHLPFKAAAFDKVISYGVFQYVKDWQGAIADLVRVTRKGGRIFIGDIPDQGKKWKLRLHYMKAAMSLLLHPWRIVDKLKYSVEGPEWNWLDLPAMVSFVRTLGAEARVVNQPRNLQYNTETYRYRVDLLIEV